MWYDKMINTNSRCIYKVIIVYIYLDMSYMFIKSFNIYVSSCILLTKLLKNNIK